MAKGASGGSKRGWGGSGGFGGGGNATNLDSLISAREGNQAEVDAVLTVYRDVNNEFGTVPTVRSSEICPDSQRWRTMIRLTTSS